MNWLRRVLGLDKPTRAESDLAEAEAEHQRRIDHADFLFERAWRKADAILRPYTGPERRRNPR